MTEGWRGMQADDARRPGPAPWRGFNEAFEVCFNEYFTFSGRASRSEFWFFTFFVIVAGIVGTAADSLTGLRVSPEIGLFGTIVSLVTFIPNLAVTSRRFHDAGWSFWWYLLILVPIVGWVFVLYVLVTLDPFPNRFDRRG